MLKLWSWHLDKPRELTHYLNAQCVGTSQREQEYHRRYEHVFRALTEQKHRSERCAADDAAAIHIAVSPRATLPERAARALRDCGVVRVHKLFDIGDQSGREDGGEQLADGDQQFKSFEGFEPFEKWASRWLESGGAQWKRTLDVGSYLRALQYGTRYRASSEGHAEWTRHEMHKYGVKELSYICL